MIHHFADTKRKDTWMIYQHCHLEIFWEKETIDYRTWRRWSVQSNGDPERTWYDVQRQLSKSLQAQATGGLSPELMLLDNHLFADIVEANSYNITFSYLLPERHPYK